MDISQDDLDLFFNIYGCEPVAGENILGMCVPSSALVYNRDETPPWEGITSQQLIPHQSN
eukprot:3688297-Pyramimonas_sp.AAC.1